jgi:hypothetical protein
MPESGKPKIYVSAFFCEKVLLEKTDLLTAIRISQGYNVRAMLFTPSDADGNPDQSREFLFWNPLIAFAVITFLSEGPIEFSFFMRGIAPDGTILKPSAPQILRMAGGADGHTLTVTMNLYPEKEGDYWFEIYVNDELANKIVLRVIHNKEVLHVEPQPSEHSRPASE